MSAIPSLLSTLALEVLEENLFRGRSPDTSWQRVFGGQVVAQALVAATSTVEGRSAHSLHAYFMLPGDPAIPIIYTVERMRDGGSFTTRRVVAIQHGRPIFTMSASFQAEEAGLDHQIDMPETPRPETLPDEAELIALVERSGPPAAKAYFARPRPVELRPVDLRHYVGREALPPQARLWMRVRERLPDDPALHRAAIAYLSDITLLDTSLYAHGRQLFDPDMQTASLDHAVWFHRPARADEWLLYVQDSPSASGGRGFNRGSLFDGAGRLVASMAQEGLVRVKQKRVA
jgi:acyl-CoA thioesterase-2